MLNSLLLCSVYPWASPKIKKTLEKKKISKKKHLWSFLIRDFSSWPLSVSRLDLSLSFVADEPGSWATSLIGWTSVSLQATQRNSTQRLFGDRERSEVYEGNPGGARVDWLNPGLVGNICGWFSGLAGLGFRLRRSYYIGSCSEGYFFIPYFPSPLLGLHEENSSEGTLTMSGNK